MPIHARIRIAAILALFALVGVTAAAEDAPAATRAAEAATKSRCLEDEPCWTWSKMGNLDRGVFVKGQSAIRVVDPCTFAHLDHKGRIDWSRTRRLRGDRFARRHGCDPRYYH